MSHSIYSQPIDAVVTWVDGNAPAHQAKLAEYCQSIGDNVSTFVEPTRFRQVGEINYCVRSLLQYAPWLRYIYIVTDAQTPSIVRSLQATPYANKVRVIDHRQIFSDFETYLPTFNSLSIETMLWRIPGLAERFIYFNDDCWLLRPVAPHDFFTENGIVLRGKRKIQTQQKWHYRLLQIVGQQRCAQALLTQRSPHRAWQELSAQYAGFTKHFIYLPHEPFPLIKKMFIDYFNAHPSMLETNIQHRLRHPMQIWPISLAQHLALKAGQVRIDCNLQAIAINPAVHSAKKVWHRLRKARMNKHVAFICMQSLDLAPLDLQRDLLAWMEEWLR